MSLSRKQRRSTNIKRESESLSRQQSLPQNELQTLLASQGQYLSGGEQDTSSTPPLNSEESEEAFGDTLVKGLKEVADKRPDDPVGYLATYLHNNANKSTDEDPPARNRQLAHQVTNPVELDDDNDTDGPRTADTPETAVSSANRDEHGQSMLHFAAARTHGRNALFQLLQETDINIGYRDELYRTARDVAIQANLPENVLEIDKWVLYLAARGETEKLVELMLEGYDTLLEVTDEEGHSIMDVVVERNQHDTQAFLQSLPQFEERREKVHAAIRNGNLQEVKELLTPEDGSSATLLAAGKNVYGRCSLHIAVLCQNEEITELIANKFPDTLRIGDNLERTALHYAMGVSKVEELSTILIKSGAKRVLKDLKGRQPTYYFMNRSDIARLQSDEEAMKS